MLLEATFGVLVLLGFLILKRSRDARRDRLPPGPPADPIIGHARFIPPQYSWKTFAEWGKTWGAYTITLYVPMVNCWTLIRTSTLCSRYWPANDRYK